MTHPITMSDDQSDDFVSRLKTLDIVVKLGWALIAGAFGLGLWVARIQMTVNETAQSTAAIHPRVRELELRESANTEKLANILKIVDRIDRKLNP